MTERQLAWEKIKIVGYGIAFGGCVHWAILDPHVIWGFCAGLCWAHFCVSLVSFHKMNGGE